jgi:uncharacterized protein
LELTILLIATIALIVAGLSKGITGMGLPVVATPILTVLYDLPTAIAITVPTTVITDIIMVIKSSKSWSVIKRGTILIISGALGIIVGANILLRVNTSILSGLLGIITILFVCTSFFSIIPTFKKNPPKWVDGIVGILCGSLQGAAGASGPLVSMYFFQMNLSRNEFLFLINCFFVVIDMTQFSTMTSMGFYEGNNLFLYSMLALIPSLLGLGFAFLFNKYISDRFFRYSILFLIAVGGILLICKSTIL